MLGSLPFHLKPCKLNGIQIRRIAKPKKLYHLPQIIYFLLIVRSISKSIILLHNSTKSCLHTLLSKGEEERLQDLLLVAILINSSLPFFHNISSYALVMLKLSTRPGLVPCDINPTYRIFKLPL